MGEACQRYTHTYLADNAKTMKLRKSPFHKNTNPLETEDGQYSFYEVTMKPKKVTDDKPVVMAAAILSNSKLHFLKFIYEVVFKFFKPGSYRLCFCDTDSIAIGIFFFIFILFFSNFKRFPVRSNRKTGPGKKI